MDTMEFVSTINIDDLSKYENRYSTIYIFPILNMKKFLYKILLFTFLIILCAYGLDLFLSWRLRTNENRVYAAWNQLYNSDIDYDLVINGSSRAWTQYSPLILDSILGINSFNLGIDGSAINRQIIKYRKYRDLHGTPLYLIQNIDLGTMAYTYGYEREQFFPYFFYDKDLILAYDQYENFSFMEKYCPCYRYIGYKEVFLEALFHDNTGHYFEYLTKGYLGRWDKWNGSQLAKLDKVECACDTNAIKIFENFLSEVTLERTKVIFVYAPVYHEVRAKMINEQQMFDMYDSIAKKFDIQILDYNDIPMCYDTTYFYNGTHLNKVGAEIFTTKLAHDIDSLGLLK